ncbi:magnesium/cobalt transporter CorA [Neobacillus pocheonensis]|uniref:Magnesium transport protein CorA n=1 Tax=Neobacillus pocheonensis TaxID=363869 RepID=A0ABT0WFW5_9BACI|nr:magnesium/cobalt transporter CorA [Neobacillus pocheonensis]
MYTLAWMKNKEWKENLPLDELREDAVEWYWVDFDDPTKTEESLLETHFDFHHLAVERCLGNVERPNAQFYGDYLFSILHHLNLETFKAEEMDCFLGEKLIVSFHKEKWKWIEKVKLKAKGCKKAEQLSPIDVFHMILDELVDGYFPIMHQLEDDITDLDENTSDFSISETKNRVFVIRKQLTRMHKTLSPMRDLVYHIMNSTRLLQMEHHHIQFNDVYDHLTKLVDLLVTNRELTADIRDSCISSKDDQTNSLMKKLTMVAIIFNPLSFLTGLFGMNFVHMPVLKGQNNFYLSLIFMVVIAIGMYIWFRRKGWFDD